MKRYWNLFIKFDATGLGIFTVIGATVGYNLFGHNFLIMSFAGILTAIGGGILRDVFVNQIPLVFIKEIYVTASFSGVIIFYVLLLIVDLCIAAIFAVVYTTVIRLLAIRYGWNLPRVKT